MAQRINQFFRLLEVTLQHLFNIMGVVAHHAPVLHHFIVELLLLALLWEGARTLLHALP